MKAIGDAFQNARQPRLGRTQRGLRLFALGDLRARGQDRPGRAFRIVVQAPAAEQIETAAIACELDDFARHFILAAQLGDELLKRTFKFRFEQRVEILPQRLLARPAEELLGATIPVDDSIPHIAHDDRVIAEV